MLDARRGDPLGEIPRLVPPDRLRSALAFNYGAYQLVGIVGPALGGLLVAGIGFGGSYLADAGSCLIMAVFAGALRPQPPAPGTTHPPILHSIAEGLRFVGRTRALAGSFAVLTGGLACIAGAIMVAVAFPALARFDGTRDAAPA